MALIKCPECGQGVSDSAESCIHCGFVLKEKPLEPVMVNVPSLSGFQRTFVVKYDNEEVTGKSGTTVEFYVEKETTIQISLKGYFGHPSIVVKPGDKIQASISGMGSVSLAKVSMLTGNANTHGW